MSNSTTQSIVPAATSGDSDCLQRRFSRTIPVANRSQKIGSSRDSSHVFTAVCAILSATVGMPNIRTPPDFFGIGTALTGGGK